MVKAEALKGRYELRDILGRGGMGVVYRAYDFVLKCDVVVKTLRECPDRTALHLFYRECEVLTALNHPNIVQILDLGEFEEEDQTRLYSRFCLKCAAACTRRTSAARSIAT
jgi:serine/threonine protein kinase